MYYEVDSCIAYAYTLYGAQSCASALKEQFPDFDIVISQTFMPNEFYCWEKVFTIFPISTDSDLPF